MEGNNYIKWIFSLEGILASMSIELSDYDEFYIKEAIHATEQIIEMQSVDCYENLTEKMIDEYADNAIEKDPSQKEYYETVAYYVKKRLLQIG